MISAALLLVTAVLAANTDAQQATSDRIRARIEMLRAGQTQMDGAPLAAGRLIADFYERRAFAPAWARPGQAEAMLALARDSRTHGLDPDDYRVAALQRVVEAAPGAGADPAERELLLTDSLVRLAYHLHFGKLDPRELYPGWNFARSLGGVDPVQALEEALAAPSLRDAVERFAPRLAMYRDLRAALARYRAIAAAGGWSGVAMEPALELRIDQIRVNLERLRWVAQDLAGDYLIVDIPGYGARLFLDGRLAWSSRVVVGKPYRETPTFRATLRDLVFNPTWTVPQSIIRDEILPKLAEDPQWLVRNHMRVVDRAGREVDGSRVDWERLRSGAFPYEIVQAAGPDNPLGRVKFLLPNPQDVYLHDTPARELFRRTVRAFSHGCIRLERPLELAVLLLDDPQRWTAEAVQAAIDSGETRTVAVRRQVPVMLLYFTAEAGEDDVTFRPDVYGRDARVLRGLNQPPRFTKVDR
jgi:murein L,D-transpeptidase YcbB/YkuD